MTITVDIVSPEKKIASLQATQVVVPGVEGDFGVLDLHAPTVSTLRPGTISVYNGNIVSDSYEVSGGFVEVDGASCTVLLSTS